MAATTGYKAANETDATQISYGIETAWGVKPVTQFQAIRYTSETLAGARTRQRPSEITGTREAAAAVTTQQTAGGTINYAFSANTFDDFFAGVLQNDWQAAQTINGAGGDITITNASGAVTLSSSTGTKFDNLSANQWIRLLGFSNAANNSYWFVSAKASGQSLSLTGNNTAVTETPTGTNAKVRASTIKNSNSFRSMFIQQSLASDQFLTYPGAYPSRMTLSGGLGNSMTGAIDIVAQTEAKQVTNQSTGAVLAAPTGRVIDPVGGFVGAYWNETVLGAGVDRFSITMDNAGAASEFAMGSSSAQGILSGNFTASGQFRCFFKDFSYYDIYQAETAGRLAFIVKDPNGYSYAFTFLSAVLNGRIIFGGPGQAVYSEFDIEGGPSGNGTLVIDRLPAS